MTDTQNNQVVRAADGKWIVPPKSPAPITHANARSMAQLRWEKYRKAAVKQILGEAQSIDTDIQTPADAWGLLMAKQYAALMDSEKPVIEQAERLGKIMTGASTESQRANEATQPGTIAGAPADIMRLVQLIEQERSAATTKARAIDADIATGNDNIQR
jgi:hypothetical protein